MSKRPIIKAVEVYSDKRAILEWETVVYSLPRGMHDVIICDFKPSSSLLSTFLDVQPSPESKVTVIISEWLPGTEYTFSWATAGIQDVDEAYWRLKNGTSGLSGNTRPRRGTRQGSLFGSPQPIYDSNEALLSSITEHKCPHEEAVPYVPGQLSDLDEWYHAETEVIRTSIRISYKADELIQVAKFRVRTLWLGLSWSRYYICSLSTLAANVCSISDVAELTKNIHISCDPCIVHLIDAPWEKAVKVRNETGSAKPVLATIFDVSLAVSGSDRAMIKQFRCGLEAHRILHYRKSTDVKWALLLTAPSNQSPLLSNEIVVNIGGALTGRFAPIIKEQYILMKDLLVDSSITVVNELKQPQKLIYNHAKDVDEAPVIIDVLQFDKKVKNAPPFVRLFGPNVSSWSVMLERFKDASVYIRPPPNHCWMTRIKYILYFIALLIFLDEVAYPY